MEGGIRDQGGRRTGCTPFAKQACSAEYETPWKDLSEMAEAADWQLSGRKSIVLQWEKAI